VIEILFKSYCRLNVPKCNIMKTQKSTELQFSMANTRINSLLLLPVHLSNEPEVLFDFFKGSVNVPCGAPGGDFSWESLRKYTPRDEQLMSAEKQQGSTECTRQMGTINGQH